MTSPLLKQLIDYIVKEHVSIKSSKKSGMLSSSFLNEDRMEDAKKKYPNISHLLDKFKAIPQKYIFWIAKQLSLVNYEGDREALVEDLVTYVLRFDELAKNNQIEQKDINVYKDATSFFRDVGKAWETKKPSRKEQKKNAKLIHKDDRFTIIQPLDMNASCYYGYGTKWCISATESDNYFNQYSSRGIEFLFIMDKKPSEPKYQKIAIAYHPQAKNTIEVYDSEDDKLSPITLNNLLPPEVISVLQPYTDIKTIAETTSKFIEQMSQVSDEQFLGMWANKFAYMDNADAKALATELIMSLPLEKLPLVPRTVKGSDYLYGEGQLVQAIHNRLEMENPSIDQLLWLMNKGIQYESLPPNHIDYYNVFESYIKRIAPEDFAYEELVKAGNFKPEGYEEAPMKDAMIDKYLWKFAKETLGIEDGHVVQELRKFYNLAQDPDRLEKRYGIWKDKALNNTLPAYWRPESKTLLKLYGNNKLPLDLLKPFNKVESNELEMKWVPGYGY